MDVEKESLARLLGLLHEQRLWTWDEAALKVNIDQRKRLVETADRARFVKAGDRVEPFLLREVGGAKLTLDELTATGPAVLIFFRFAGCPACNIAIPYYARNLWPGLERLGVRLVAVSPQKRESLIEIKQRHKLGFEVATDEANTLARRFGILYEFDEPSKAAALAAGRFIGDVTGTGTWELPQPTVVVIGQDGLVRFADVSPDWMVRTEADTILEAVRPLLVSKAA